MSNFDLYYEITDDGYWIYDRNSDLKIHQYEPYIPDHSKSYEENAIAQIEELMKQPEPAPEPEPEPSVDPFDNPQYAAGYEQALLDMMEEEEA